MTDCNAWKLAYPRCYNLGVLLVTPAGPRVNNEHITNKLTEEQFQLWLTSEKNIGIDVVYGLYAWDVEDFLKCFDPE